jgi:hypothetical protein
MLFLIVVCIGVAILRYRLWDIDIVIRRTVAYILLTGLLAMAYLSSVVVLQGLARVLTGSEQNQLVSVASTLAIAGLFNPLRRRVQDSIDRRFHRSKYNTAQVVAAFTVACHNEVELARLSGEFGRVMQMTLQPAQIGLWLKPTHEQKRSNAAGLMRDKGRGAT